MMDRDPLIVAPYDAELFGHWWFEGPEWLYDVLKAIDADPELEAVTCEEALAATPPTTVVALPEGSWGQGGFHWVWLNEWNEWIWKRVYQAEREMQELVEEFGSRKDDRLHGVLEQAARELLLLESSDWQFLISTWSARDYAEARAADHFESFERLRDLARRYGRGEPVDAAEWTFLHECRERDRAFARIDLNWFARLEHPIG
jgi:1,4-alpha-glucan branching enzyme